MSIVIQKSNNLSMAKYYILILLFISCCLGVNAQVKFQKLIQNTDYGYGYTGLEETYDHNLVGFRSMQRVPAYTYPQLVVEKFDFNGKRIWRKGIEILGLPNNPILKPRNIKELPDRGFMCFGEFLSNIYFVFKLDSTGNTVWQKYFVDSLGYAFVYVEPLSDGGFAVVTEKMVRKLDANGNTISTFEIAHTNVGWVNWNKTMSDAPAGSFIVSGMSRHTVGNTIDDLSLFKFDNNLNIVWQKTYSSPLDTAEYIIDMVCDADGGFTALSGGSACLLLLKFDANGVKLWNKRLAFAYNANYDFDPYFLRQDKVLSHVGNKYLICGKAANSAGTEPEPFLALVDSAGNTMQQKRLCNYGSYLDRAMTATATQDNKIFVSYQGVPQIGTTATKQFIARIDSLNFSGGCTTYPLTLSTTSTPINYTNAAHPTDSFILVPTTKLGSTTWSTAPATPFGYYDCICNSYFRAGFTNLRDSICAGDSLFFTNTAAIGDTFAWRVNNVTLSNNQNFGYRFTASGNYTIRLVVSESGCLDSFSKVIRVYAPAAQSSTSSAACSGVSTGQMNVTATGGPAPYTYTWQPNVSAAASATNLNPGIYCVTVTNRVGCAVTVCDTVEATQGISTSSFNAAVCNGASYLFNGQNLTVAGAYSDTVSTQSGCDSIVTLNLTVNPLPVVALAGNTDTLCFDGVSVALTGGSPAGGTYSGGGVSANSFNPSAVSIGSHVVTYSYTDGNNCIAQATEVIVVDSCLLPPPPCYAIFSIYPDTVNTAGVYYGYNQSTGTNLSYLWQFGDGNASNLQYPSHTYSAPGHYNVCLTVNNGVGCSNTYCDSSFYVFKTEGGLMVQLNIKDPNAPTGINEPGKELAVIVYPNPATNQLTVGIGGLQAEHVKIYSMDGRQVSEVKLPAHNTIDISALAKGVYIAEIGMGKITQKVRWVKM